MSIKTRVEKLERKIEVLECNHEFVKIDCVKCAIDRLSRVMTQRYCAMRNCDGKDKVTYSQCKGCGVVKISWLHEGKKKSVLDTF